MGSSYGINTVVGGFLVGAAIGFAASKIGPTPKPLDVCHTQGNHNIEVGTDGTVDCPEAVIGMQNSVKWFSADGSGLLTITFRDATVFPALPCQGTTTVCVSGPPTVKWKTGETSRDCEYYGQVKSGANSRPINGHIVIIKP